MATYKVLHKSFLNNAIAEEGEIVEYDGEVSENLELVPTKVVIPDEEPVPIPVKGK